MEPIQNSPIDFGKRCLEIDKELKGLESILNNKNRSFEDRLQQLKHSSSLTPKSTSNLPQSNTPNNSGTTFSPISFPPPSSPPKTSQFTTLSVDSPKPNAQNYLSSPLLGNEQNNNQSSPNRKLDEEISKFSSILPSSSAGVASNLMKNIEEFLSYVPQTPNTLIDPISKNSTENNLSSNVISISSSSPSILSSALPSSTIVTNASNAQVDVFSEHVSSHHHINDEFQLSNQNVSGEHEGNDHHALNHETFDVANTNNNIPHHDDSFYLQHNDQPQNRNQNINSVDITENADVTSYETSHQNNSINNNNTNNIISEYENTPINLNNTHHHYISDDNMNNNMNMNMNNTSSNSNSNSNNNSNLQYSNEQQAKLYYLQQLEDERKKNKYHLQKIKSLESALVDLKKRFGAQIESQSQTEAQMMTYQQKLPTLVKELEILSSHNQQLVNEKQLLLSQLKEAREEVKRQKEDAYSQRTNHSSQIRQLEQQNQKLITEIYTLNTRLTESLLLLSEFREKRDQNNDWLLQRLQSSQLLHSSFSQNPSSPSSSAQNFRGKSAEFSGVSEVGEENAQLKQFLRSLPSSMIPSSLQSIVDHNSSPSSHFSFDDNNDIHLNLQNATINHHHHHHSTNVHHHGGSNDDNNNDTSMQSRNNNNNDNVNNNVNIPHDDRDLNLQNKLQPQTTIDSTFQIGTNQHIDRKTDNDNENWFGGSHHSASTLSSQNHNAGGDDNSNDIGSDDESGSDSGDINDNGDDRTLPSSLQFGDSPNIILVNAGEAERLNFNAENNNNNNNNDDDDNDNNVEIKLGDDDDDDNENEEFGIGDDDEENDEAEVSASPPEILDRNSANYFIQRNKTNVKNVTADRALKSKLAEQRNQQRYQNTPKSSSKKKLSSQHTSTPSSSSMNRNYRSSLFEKLHLPSDDDEFDAKILRPIIYTPVSGDEVDSLLANVIINSLAEGLELLPPNFKRLTFGIYQFGSKKIHISVQNRQPVVRVGGGFEPFVKFVQKYGRSECIRISKQSKEFSPIENENTSPVKQVLTPIRIKAKQQQQE